MPDIRNVLRETRTRRGFTAAELAKHVQVSRQTIYAIEDGTYVPNTAIALRLARILDVSVEDLFSLPGPDETSDAQVLGPGEGLVRLCHVNSKLIAVRVSQTPAYLPLADGVVEGGRIRSISDVRDDGKRMIIAGCDPALSLLSEMMSATGHQVITAPASSRTALKWLKQEQVHAAGSHLKDKVTGEYNVPIVREYLGGDAVRIVTFASWEQGLLIAKGNPKRIQGFADMGRKDVTVVNREAGSGSRDLLDAGLSGAGIPQKLVKGYKVTASGHLAAALAVANGDVDCCVANRSAARYFGLDFIPVAAERFDLTFSKAALDLPVTKALLEGLNRSSFRRKLEALAGYDTTHTGETLL